VTTAPENRGGYRKPSNPAPASGPGALSQRTDGGPTQAATYIPGLPYGQGQETYNNQTSAPMAGTPYDSLPTQPIPLNAPTQYPDEPGTAGINRGDGGGSELLAGMPKLKPNPMDTLKKVNLFDDSGEAELILMNFFNS
jgi:hypothetical protein